MWQVSEIHGSNRSCTSGIVRWRAVGTGGECGSLPGHYIPH